MREAHLRHLVHRLEDALNLRATRVFTSQPDTSALSMLGCSRLPSEDGEKPQALKG